MSYFIFSGQTPEKIPCQKDLVGVQGYLSSKDDISNETLNFHIENRMPIDCLWTITVRPGWRVSNLVIYRFLVY